MIYIDILCVHNSHEYKKYFEAFMKFADIRTLPERMKNEETLAMEYRMKDGRWRQFSNEILDTELPKMLKELIELSK